MDNGMSYEQKEKRLNEILERLDRGEIPVDRLAAEAREAAGLIVSMAETLRGAGRELEEVFRQLDQAGGDLPAGR